MAFDYKKEYKEFYMPKGTPSIVTVPKMNYIAVRGSVNPNDEDGEYAPTPVTTYALFCDGKYVTNEQMNASKPAGSPALRAGAVTKGQSEHEREKKSADGNRVDQRICSVDCFDSMR